MVPSEWRGDGHFFNSPPGSAVAGKTGGVEAPWKVIGPDSIVRVPVFPTGLLICYTYGTEQNP